jgi:ABC-type polysaccharide/polyol phosphate export permease
MPDHIDLRRWRRVLSLGLEIAKAVFKLRNEGSYLGIIWYLLNPVLMFFILFIIFSDRLGGDIPRYSAYLLLGIIMFNYFQSVTQESTQIIRTNASVIKTIPFPPIALNWSVVMVALFSHAFELLIFVVLLIGTKTLSWGILVYPLIVILFTLFCLGCSLVLSALAVYFTDLYHIWSFAVRLLWLGTPIFYSFGEDSILFKFNLLNPIFYFITIARDLIIYGDMPQIWAIAGAVGFAAVMLIGGLAIHNSLKHKLPELI